MKKDENQYTIHTSIDNTVAELVKLECTNCGGSLKLTDPTHASCPYCGQSFLIDEAKGTVINISFDYEDTPEVRQTINSTRKMLVLFLVIIVIFVLVILGINIAANSSVFSSSDRDAAFEENGRLLAIFCKDVFGKDYKDVTDEELASIRYIRYEGDRDVNDGFHVIKYSFTNYEDCESEEEFQNTIETWTYHNTKANWPSDFTMFTGLTRVDNSSSLWFSLTEYSKEAQISYIETDEVLANVTASFQPEYVKVLHMGSQSGHLEGIEEYKNLEELVVDGYSGRGEQLDITGIGSCTELETLYLNSGIVNAGLEELKKLSNIKSLYLSGVELKDSSFLKDMPNLEELSTNIGESGDLSMLENVPNLKRLHFIDNELTDIDALLSLKELEEVNITVDELEQLRQVTRLENLKSLEVDLQIFGDGRSAVDVSVLADLPNLEILKIDDFWDGDLAGMEYIFNKQGMKSIAVGDETYTSLMTQVVLNPDLLVDNPSVEEVKLAGWKNAEDGKQEKNYDFLLHYPNLRVLDLGGNELQEVDFIADLTNLEAVDLQGNNISDFSPLSSCRKLKQLYIYGNPQTTPEFPETVEVYTEAEYKSILTSGL